MLEKYALPEFNGICLAANAHRLNLVCYKDNLKKTGKERLQGQLINKSCEEFQIVEDNMGENNSHTRCHRRRHRIVLLEGKPRQLLWWQIKLN